MEKNSDNKQDAQDVLKRIRELHDELKSHPYWNIFDHGMFRNEVYPALGELMKEISNLRYFTDYPDTPIICIFKDVYHDFNAMRTRIFDMKDAEQKDEFKMFYLPVMQAYIQLAHMLIEGLDKDAENISMIMPNEVYKPRWIVTFVPEYKDKWVNSDGYVIHSKPGWYAVIKIREDDVERYNEQLNAVIKIQEKKKGRSSQSLIDYFRACLKDIKDRTNFIYKVV